MKGWAARYTADLSALLDLGIPSLHGADLAGRDPAPAAGSGLTQVAAADEAATVARITP